MAAADWWRKPRIITIVVDTPGWFDPFAEALTARLHAEGDDAALARTHDEVRDGAVALYLSCLRITPPEVLARNRLNLVAHASDLPRGRGFSPLVWQTLEGRNLIPLRLIDAAEPVDSGDIRAEAEIAFEGHELNDEMRDRMGAAIMAMCERFLAADAPAPGRPQSGEPSSYRRRHPDDSRLDPTQSLLGQFDLLRVVDNERYPAFFDARGHRYRLRIEKIDKLP